MKAFIHFAVGNLDFIAIPQSPEFFRIIDEDGNHYGTWSNIDRFILCAKDEGAESYKCGSTKILLK